MSIVDDTRKSLYAILAKRLLEGNNQFTARLKNGGCYSGKQSHNVKRVNFETWAKNEALMLESVSGNIIPVDETLLKGFPQPRPSMCVPQGTPARKGDPNEWTRSWYWSEKKTDYYIYKQKIDDYVKTLQDSMIFDVPKSSIVASSSLIPLAIIGFLLLYTRGGKK
jgi:hypothetical protein